MYAHRSTTHISAALRGSLAGSFVLVVLSIISFFFFEPAVGQSAEEIFTVTQSITSEISFLASTSPVTMNGAIAGATGGTSYGTTTSRVQTNNSTGYNMTISFASTSAMNRNGGGGYISNYVYSTSTASYPAGFDTSPAYGQFAFTVNASSTSEISSVFTHSGSLCGTSNNGSFTVNNCWRGASSTDAAATTEVINATGATPVSGSTSTIQFRVVVPNNPTPAIPNGTYTATVTLTATVNP
ncbi:hypothetical protein KC727_01350 [Candidatus Kaiserbacteria bacterium]|nr:hypothetical protein [Candidatus Kaiserbacteria bacterium]